MRRTILLTALSIAIGAVSAHATTVITPSSMGNWSLFTTDNASNTPGSGSGTGTAAIGTAPVVQTDGSGSVQLATGPNHGDESAQLRDSGEAGTLLTALTTLSYSTYTTASNGGTPPGVSVSQDTYLKFYLSNGDEIIFEPTYGDGGDVANPNGSQAVPAFDTWQNWDLLKGMWYSDNGDFGTGPGSNSVSWQTIIADEGSGVTIVNPSSTLGGVRIAVGFASAGNDFNSYVDDFTIGTAAGSATYNFEPDSVTAVPLPASAWSGLALLSGLALFGGVKRLRQLHA
ncbi:MAG TPA: hypothetical protein VFE58_14375 [Tepidisphaeraceae bacterium]|jgi:hypothetical protein|nr:hypothetical protein [Tepidisphaeraceae bacterium]